VTVRKMTFDSGQIFQSIVNPRCQGLISYVDYRCRVFICTPLTNQSINNPSKRPSGLSHSTDNHLCDMIDFNVCVKGFRQLADSRCLATFVCGTYSSKAKARDLSPCQDCTDGMTIPKRKLDQADASVFMVAMYLLGVKVVGIRLFLEEVENDDASFQPP